MVICKRRQPIESNMYVQIYADYLAWPGIVVCRRCSALYMYMCEYITVMYTVSHLMLRLSRLAPSIVHVNQFNFGVPEQAECFIISIHRIRILYNVM
jgi:hypothetical protein